MIWRVRSEGGEIAAFARATGVSRQTVYRILGDDSNAQTGFTDAEPAGKMVSGTGQV
jgi:DNA invertase Pin-like site-specific DNA recombinase